MTAGRKWTSEELTFLTENAYKVSWEIIAAKLGRSEMACKAKFKKLRELRQFTGTWKGI